jgi:hypothetical protein
MKFHVGKLQDWLSGSAKSPNELVLKNRLKELMGKVEVICLPPNNN